MWLYASISFPMVLAKNRECFGPIFNCGILCKKGVTNYWLHLPIGCTCRYFPLNLLPMVKFCHMVHPFPSTWWATDGGWWDTCGDIKTMSEKVMSCIKIHKNSKIKVHGISDLDPAQSRRSVEEIQNLWYFHLLAGFQPKNQLFTSKTGVKTHHPSYFWSPLGFSDFWHF